jgi:hypothetical protein
VDAPLQNLNVDCALGDVTFIDDSDETMDGNQSPATMCAANAIDEGAMGDQNEIGVR